MNKMHLKWMCNGNIDSDAWEASEYFDTKEEAISAGTKALRGYLANPAIDYDQYDVLGCEYDIEVYGTPSSFAVAQIFSPSFGIDAGSVLESIQENAYSEGGEFSDGYLDDVTKEQEEELEQKLNEVFAEWTEKYNLHPNFYTVGDIEVIRLGEGEEE